MKTKSVKVNNYFVQTLSDGLRLMQYIELKRENLSLVSIARDLQWDKSKVRRLLLTLVQEEFLEYDPLEKVYMLGGRILGLHKNLMQVLKVEPRLSHKFVQELAEETMGIGALAILRGEKVAMLDVVSNHQPGSFIRQHSIGIGASAPAFCVAHGKVFLAAIAPAKATQLLHRSTIKALTPYTKTDLKEVLKELKQIHAQGYAIENRERNPNVCAVAAPVRDSIEVVASVGVFFPASDFSKEKILSLAEHVKRIARRIEESAVKD